MLKPGDIIRYGYLWARQADAGEETGRKARPACVVVRTPSNPAALFVFPLTSQNPGTGQPHLPVPEIECRRAGLDFPTYLVIDEYNRFLENEAFDLEAPAPIGAFSTPFLERIASAIKALSTARRVRGVVRR
jgi:hypothetical protein